MILMLDSAASQKKNILSFLRYLKCSYKTLILIAVIAAISVLCTVIVIMLISPPAADYYVSSHGTVKTLTVEAYWDAACQNEVETISWDVLEPGETVNITLYLKNASNVPINLGINLTDWKPVEFSDYMTFFYEYDGGTLIPSEVIQVTLMLSASSSDDFVYFLVENKIQDFDVNLHFFGLS